MPTFKIDHLGVSISDSTEFPKIGTAWAVTICDPDNGRPYIVLYFADEDAAEKSVKSLKAGLVGIVGATVPDVPPGMRG